MRDRGQAEVVGYVLVFSLVVLAVGLVTIPGFAGLTDLRDNQRTANVEQGFTVLADNIDDVVRGEATSRATELRLSGGRLSLGAPVTVNVSAQDSNGQVFKRSRSVRPLIYQAPNNAQLVYTGGAVIGRGQDGGVVLLKPPRLVLSSERTVIPLIATDLDRQQLRAVSDRVDSESRVLVRTERRERRLLNQTDVQEVTISVTSPRTAAWKRYLEARGGSCSESGDEVSCTFSTNRVTVTLVRVAVSFE